MYPSLAGKPAAKTAMNLQDIFLNRARRDNMTVRMCLINGLQIEGKVRGFDNFTVILETVDGQQMIYKHAVMSIQSEKPVIVLPADKRE